MSESTADRNPFERLAEEFAERLRRGEHPSLTEYVERYPEHADDIRELFPALALVEQYKPARQERRGSSAAPVPATRGDLPDAVGRLPDPPLPRRRRHGRGLRGGARVAPQPRRAQGHASAVSATARSTCAGSTPRPARRPGCTTPTSSASSTTASTTASAITRCSTSPATAWTRSWPTSASSARRKRDCPPARRPRLPCHDGQPRGEHDDIRRDGQRRVRRRIP